MKYTVAMVVLVTLGAFVIGDGYVKSVRAEQHTLALRAALSKMSVQQLAEQSWECSPRPGASSPAIHDTAYCTEVVQALSAKPLEGSMIMHREVVLYTPMPAPKYQKVTVVAPPMPSLPSAARSG
jgi:hypothetical protein